jgi:hypothetical protein
VKIRGKGLEGSYWLGISIRRYRYDVFFSPNINPGCMRVDEG